MEFTPTPSAARMISRICRLSQVSSENIPNAASSSFCADRRLSLEHLARLKPCTNIMTLFPAGGSSTDQNIRGMQRHKALYGIYAYYEDSDGGQLDQPEPLPEFSSYESSFVLMIPRDNCSKSYQDRIDAYIRSARIQQLHPLSC